MYRLIAVLTLLTISVAAHAGDLRIGRATEQGSLDPLYSDLGSDVIISRSHWPLIKTSGLIAIVAGGLSTLIGAILVPGTTTTSLSNGMGGVYGCSGKENASYTTCTKIGRAHV